MIAVGLQFSRSVYLTDNPASLHGFATRMGSQFVLGPTILMDAQQKLAGPRQNHRLGQEDGQGAQPKIHSGVALPSVPVDLTTARLWSPIRPTTILASLNQKRSPNE